MSLSFNCVSVARPLTSLQYEPMRGAMDSGMPGLIKGVGRGVAGLGLKPLIGAVDLVTRAAEGIRNTTTYWEEKKRGRVRPPRFFGKDKVLQPSSLRRALGQELLYTVEEARYRGDFYMHHFEEDLTIVVISDRNIISLNKANIQIEEWHVRIKGSSASDLFGLFSMASVGAIGSFLFNLVSSASLAMSCCFFCC